MKSPTTIFFEQIDKNLEYHAKQIRNQVFSEYRDMAWTNEQYKVLQPLIRNKLDNLMWSTLKMFDNVGGVLPEEVLGYNIVSHLYQEIDSDIRVDKEGIDIRNGYDNYCDMWEEFLLDKP